MKISPEYKIDNWKSVNFSTEEGWQKAIDIFEDRIQGRFLEFVDKIEKYEFAGFAILAIDCLLIETLQQFREGKAETPHYESGDYFDKFLTETSFKAFFTKEYARLFYEQFRCGILHQAEIKESSRVSIKEDDPLVRLTQDGKGLIINRRLFHNELVKAFEEYLSELRNSVNSDSRKKFKKKMDYICRVNHI